MLFDEVHAANLSPSGSLISFHITWLNDHTNFINTGSYCLLDNELQRRFFPVHPDLPIVGVGGDFDLGQQL